MINEYDRPVKGYKTSEQYDHPATVLYDNFAPKVEEEVFATDTVEAPEVLEETLEEILVEPTEVAEEIIEEKEGEE